VSRRLASDSFAISPIVGVILMIVITVAMSAIVFVLVNDQDQQETAPVVGFKIDEGQDRIRVARAPDDVDWSEFQVRADADVPGLSVALNEAADGAGTETAVSTAVATLPAKAIEGGDFLEFCADARTDGVTVYLLYTATNTLILEVKWLTVDAC